MAPHYPLYVKRSDGQLDTKSSKSAREPNEPPPDQLSQKPNAQGVCDFYRQCGLGDAKEEDWRRKLAGMLIREIGTDQTRDKSYILASMPQNYRLFEHVKFKASADPSSQPTDRASKNHAGGGNDRQDAYLYGHPLGRKKRYRSPAEFFPHLLWLATDESGDPSNCSCKFCSPEELEEDKTKASANTVAAKLASPALTKAAAPPLKQAAPAQAKARPQALSRSNLPTSTELPPFRSKEQKLDAQYNNFIFRNGEIVWYQRRQGAWGLGVVVKREAGTSSKPNRYAVQPLSNPLQEQTQEVTQHEQMRPWLAWSPPPCTNPGLNPLPENGNKEYTFATTDWAAVVQGRFAGPNGEGDALVDGSILAARQVETTFTPFQPLPKAENQPAGDMHYNGIYVGGEKLWVGDALRLRNGTTLHDILVLHDILERANPQDVFKPIITLMGDVYTPRTVELEPQAVPSTYLHLPLRVREDLAARNKVTSQGPVPQRRHNKFWRLIVKGSRNKIGDIKGRVYETSILAPLLDANAFREACAKGEWNDVGGYMNGQGDCNRSTIARPGREPYRPADIKAETREAAFGLSVPRGLTISKGLDEAASGSGSGPGTGRPGNPAAKQEPAPSAPYGQGYNAQQTGQQPGQHQQQQVPMAEASATASRPQEAYSQPMQNQPLYTQQQQQQQQVYQPQQQHQHQQQYAASSFDEQFIDYDTEGGFGQSFGGAPQSEYPHGYWMDGAQR